MRDPLRGRQEHLIVVGWGGGLANRNVLKLSTVLSQSNLRVIHFLQITTLRSAAPSLHACARTHACTHTHTYTLWSHHTDKSVSMCSLFIAPLPPHSSLLLRPLFLGPFRVLVAMDCSSCEAGVFVCEPQTKTYRNIAGRHSSHLMQHEWDTSCSTGVRLVRW